MPSMILASSDPGEELDDLLAFKYGFLNGQKCSMGEGKKVHLIISGGSINPERRLDYLNDYMQSSHTAVATATAADTTAWTWKFGEEHSNVTLYADDEHLLLSPNTYDVYVNNGPLTSITMIKVAKSLKNAAVLYLVGSNSDGTGGGINQIDTTPNIPRSERYTAWNEIFIPLINSKGTGSASTGTGTETGTVHKVVLLPQLTRKIRFPNHTQLFPTHPYPTSFIRDIAKRTVGMFIISRPTPFPVYRDLLRFNSSHHYCCMAWLKEMKEKDHHQQEEGKLLNSIFSISEQAAQAGGVKCAQYISACRAFVHDVQIHIEGQGPGDSHIHTQAQARPLFTEEQIEELTPLALLPFQLTYELALRVYLSSATDSSPQFLDSLDPKEWDPYKPDKFGFFPESKMQSNPENIFVNDTIFSAMCDVIMNHFCTLTPAYDLLSALLAMQGVREGVDTNDEVRDYNAIVKRALAL